MDRLLMILTRFAAFFIDLFIYGLVYLFLSNYGVLGYLLSLLFLFLYRVIMQTYFGQTVGMMLLKIKLVRYSFKIALKREIFRIASSLFFIGYIYAILDKNLRTFHDISSQTYVDYVDKEYKEPKDKNIVKCISYIFLFISIIKGTSNFLLNEIGEFGLIKYLSSDEYFQSFEGDNLVSLSQDELYLKTVGRRYTAVIDEDGKNIIYRISNKLRYTEVYRLNIEGRELIGEYRFKIDFPIQFINSGHFRDRRDFCSVTPKGDLILFSNTGDIFSNIKIENKNIVNLKTGDIDKDGKDEIFILNRNGDIYIYKYLNRKLFTLYSGKIGEDIIPYTFLVDDGIIVLTKADERVNVYRYDFINNKFKIKDKKTIKIKEATNIFRFNKNYLINHVARNNMTFKVGKIQTFEVLNEDFKKIYNFGKRPARRYSYMVRIVEDVCDLDKDGVDEIIVKSIGKDDVMGQGYKIEVYKQNSFLLYINRLLSMWS